MDEYGPVGGSSILAKVAWLTASVVPSEASCGITVRDDNDDFRTAASDARGARLDRAQCGTGTGPGLEAMASGAAVEVRDQQADLRWEGYRDAALAQGVRCSLSLPLTVAGAAAGVLNVYGLDKVHVFDSATRRNAEAFADLAATALVATQQLRRQERLADQFVEAVRARAAVDQALGVLMAEEQCDVDTAFAMLRHHSQTTNQRLRDVAARIVAGATGHPPGVLSDFEA
jgi:GAF domain-containing protein